MIPTIIFNTLKNPILCNISGHRSRSKQWAYGSRCFIRYNELFKKPSHLKKHILISGIVSNCLSALLIVYQASRL